MSVGKTVPGTRAGRDGIFELEGMGAWEGAEEGLCCTARGSAARECQTGGGAKTHAIVTHWATLC